MVNQPKIKPNHTFQNSNQYIGRIPALTDTFEDGKLIRLFESGSILQYLAEQYDTEYKISYPKGSRESYEVNNWLFFQVLLSKPTHSCSKLEDLSD
jgi:glutathione S-transferase